MIEIVGLESLISKLNSLDGDVIGTLRVAVQRTTLSAKGAAKRMVPVDTSMLKQSISHEFKDGSDYTSGEVYAFMPYAIHVEMGTSRTIAQPYMMPALNSHRTVFKSEATRALNAAIKKLGG